MRGHCKNHPQVSAKRRCFQCQAYICVDCQILAERHYFCSLACYKQFQGAGLTSPSVSVDVKPPPKPAPKSSTTPGRRLLRTWRMLDRNLLAQISLFSLLVFVLWLNIDYRQQLDSLRTQLNAQNHVHNGKTNLDAAALKVSSPVNGSMVLSNAISIEGEAPSGQIISLIINENVKAVTLPTGGRFQFANIQVNRGQNTFTVRSISENGEVIDMETIYFNFNNPTLNYLSRDITRGDLAQRQVALTFDGGYLANASPEILDVLKDRKVKCTMFLSGTFSRKFPDIVKRMVAEGHEIGNHSNHHPHLTNFSSDRIHVTRPEVTREFLHKELNDAAHDFTKVTGAQFAPLWRAPYGEHNLEIRQWAAELGYRHVGWTIGNDWDNNMDTMDWVADSTSPAYRSAEEILDKILNFGNGSVVGASGAIIIMHLGTLRNEDFPHQKLAEIIDGLRERGYQLVRVSEMMN